MKMTYLDVCHRVIKAFQDNPLTVSVAVGSLYTAYYLLVVVKRPLVACRDPGLKRLIDSHCPVSRERYWPTWWCFQSHLQTLLSAVVQSKPCVNYRSELLPMPDGGQVKLDWVDSEASPHPPASRPTVIMLPGLTGSSEDSYVLHIVQETTRLGYRCVVFNNRGNGGAKLLTPRSYCAADTRDLEVVVGHVNRILPQAPVIGTGVSLGACILLNYLASKGKETGLCAAVCFSVAWDFFKSAESLEKPLPLRLYNRYLTRLLVQKLESYSHIFKEHVDVVHALKSRTIREFDERFTSRQFGFDSCDHYYRSASLHNKIHALRIPVLTLNAADDPFSPLHAIPVEEAYTNDHIAMVVTSHGGHIGFLEGAFPRGKNYMHRWFAQFVDAVFKHGLKKD